MPFSYVEHNIPEALQGIRWLQKELARISERAALAAERYMLRLYRRTTQSWRRNVDFASLIDHGPWGYSALVGTDDDIYNIVDVGAKPHPIFPKGPWPLRFIWGGPGSYKAKTAPGVINSWPGGPSGVEVRRPFIPKHPGHKARRFSETITEKTEGRIVVRVTDWVGAAVDKAARMFGKGG